LKNRNRIYTIILVGFGVLAIWFRITEGPNTIQLLNITTTPSPEQYPPILGYSLKDEQNGEVLYSVGLNETGTSWIIGEDWQPSGAINQQVASQIALMLSRLEDFIEYGFTFEASDDISIYGLNYSSEKRPQYILSFLANIGENAYNNIQVGELVLVTFYIGEQRPTKTRDYYAVSVNPDQTYYRGNRVYYIDPSYVSALVSLASEVVDEPTTNEDTSVPAPLPSNDEIPE
jgi:hypothetical protein